MLARAFAAEVPAAWVAGDEIYGNDGDLRRWLEGEHRPYVWRWRARTRSGRRARRCGSMPWWSRFLRRAGSASTWAAGSKGPRIYDWACARLAVWTEEGWAQWLLIRRSVSQPEELAFYRAFGCEEATLAELAQVAGTRWTIEEGFQRAKEIGLDQYEVRRWAGWHRHITLCLLAHAFLEVTRAAAQTDAKGGPTRSLIPLTVPEVRRLLAIVLRDHAQHDVPACIGPAGVGSAKPRPAAVITNAASLGLLSKCRCSIRACFKTPSCPPQPRIASRGSPVRVQEKPNGSGYPTARASGFETRS